MYYLEKMSKILDSSKLIVCVHRQKNFYIVSLKKQKANQMKTGISLVESKETKQLLGTGQGKYQS